MSFKIKIIFFFSFLILSCSSYPLVPVSFPEEENRIKAWAYFFQGLQFEKAQRWTAAVESFSIASTFDPKSCRIYIHLANGFIRLQLYNEGIEALKKAEKYIEQYDYLAYFDIGQVYQLAKLYTQARRCYEKTLTIFPDFEQGLQALASLSLSEKSAVDKS